VTRARVYLTLGRVSNLPTVWTNVLAGVVLAGASVRPATTAFLAVAISLFYVGGMFLNDAFDRGIDARERPERPIPAGLVGAGEVFAVGFALLAAGWLAVAALAGARSAASLAALALGGAVVLYDVWHKGNSLGPVLMGLCRVLVYVTAGLAVVAQPAPALGRGALALLAYLIGLSYIAKHEARGSLAGLWPLAFLAVPFVYGSPALTAGVAGVIVYLWLVAAVGTALRILAAGGPGSIPHAVVTLIAGISLVDAVLIARAGANVTLVAALGFPLTLAAQRYVRGT
jgi:4-hydroxybenzoate polyprenyltransferase